MTSLATGSPRAFTAEGLLEQLDPEQREVVLAPPGPLCVLAGAGTGKTRAITHRIAYSVLTGQATPQRILAVTFTARAAGEMRVRLRDLGVGGVQARTFHAASLRQLGYFWPQVIGGSPPNVVDHKAALVGEAANRLRLSVDRASVRDLAAEIEWSKVGMHTAETYPKAAAAAGRGAPAGLDSATIARLLTVYEDVKDERGVIDFEDVLLLMVGILQENPQVANAVREQYRHFVVDEFQDVSAVQERLLRLWLGDRRDVCVVGDPSQTIYSFAGADPAHLLRFRQRFADAKVIELIRDYRSTPQIVTVANALMAGAVARGGPAPLKLTSMAADGPAPTLTAYDDDEAEAAGVAAQIQKLVGEQMSASQIAVLFRTNAQSAAIEQALANAGIGYLVRGGERFFNRKEVREAILLLRGAARASADDSAGLIEDTRSVLSGLGWTMVAPNASGAVREKWESHQALVNLAEDLAAANPNARLSDLVAELEERSAMAHAPSVDGVTVASLHAAKGLEWDAVFLVGMSEGLMPISFAASPAAVEEERRLLYVGVTRAKRILSVSWTRSRSGGQRGNRSPSRFLADLMPSSPAATNQRQAAKPAPKRTRTPSAPRVCRTCGTLLERGAQIKIGLCETCPPDFDEAVYERLREWRAATAKENGFPAYVIFTDATLIAIASANPADAMALARVAGVGPAKLERYGEQVLQLLSR